MREPYRIPPLFTGEKVVLVASGASLTCSQVRHIVSARVRSKCRIVAVNDGVFPVWGVCDWLHASDYKWWEWHKEDATRFPGIRTTLSETTPVSWAPGWLRNTGIAGFDPEPGTCRTGSNSAYQMIHNLIHAEAKEIILLGVDMQGDHYFGKHRDGIVPDFKTVMVPRFKSILAALAEREIRVFNCSPGSALPSTVFPHVALEQCV